MSEYFVHSVEFSNRFTQSSIWNKQNITKFACRLIEDIGNDWNSMKSFFKNNFSDYSPGVEFGYYGQTSVCMPRFHVVQGEDSWEYSLGIICINFMSFVYIAVGYIIAYKKSFESQIKIESVHRDKNRSTMQRRISRIIITDFLCWIPICIMAFVKLSGVYVDDVAYIVSAGLLLPINSAFNPLLYSSLLGEIVTILRSSC